VTAHTYFVGTTAAWVHNDCGELELGYQGPKGARKVLSDEGGFMKTYKDEGDPDVYKVAKARVRYSDDQVRYISEDDGAKLVETHAGYHNKVADALGDVVPREEVVGKGVVKQKFSDGLTYDDIKRTGGWQAKKNATDQIKRLVAKAQKATDLPAGATADAREVPGGYAAKIDDNVTTFRFDQDGNVTSWFDPVILAPIKR
jgi:hypothetical protein